MQQKSSYLKDLLSTLQVKAIMGDYTLCGEGWCDLNYFPDYYRIYYIVDGEGWIKVGNKDLFPRKGEFYWLPANIPQQYSFTNKNNLMLHYWVHFYATISGNTPLFDIIKLPFCIQKIDENHIKEIFKNLLQSQNQPSGLADGLLVKSGLLKLISYYMNACENNISMTASSSMDEIGPVVEYIENNLSSEITLLKLAQLVNLHPNYFSEKFSRIMGISPIKYIIQKRIEKAKTLLSLSSKQISDIAQETGFSDQFQFSSLFRKYVNMSPSEFRSSYKNTKES